VVSANVNGVRAAARRGGLAWLADWVAGQDVDVLCLQEVRATTDQLRDVLDEGGLGGWNLAHSPAAVPGRAGVAVLSRLEAIEVRAGFADAVEFDGQGRWIEADVALPGGAIATVVSCYVHTGEAGTSRQDEKYRFLDLMSARMRELAACDARGAARAVLTGDLNIAHREADLKNWKGNLGKAGFLPAERAYLDRWIDGGWVDSVRALSGDGPGPYTWWSWRGRAFDTDTGWRIDYVLATSGLAGGAVKATVGRAASYAERWSDHAPVTVWFE
jgi:exodeoxyribonuclease-3